MPRSSYPTSAKIQRLLQDVACFALMAALAPWGLAGPLEDATAAFDRAQYTTAIRILEGSGAKSPGEAFLLGRAQFQIGRFDDAAKTLERAVAADSRNSRYYNWLGRAYGMQAEKANPFSAMGLARKARDAFEKAVELDRTNLEAISDLFSYYLAAPGFLGGGLDKATALAASVERQDAAEYAGLLAQIAEKRKEYGEAEKQYRAAIARSSKSIGRWIDLAKFYTRRELTEKADAALAEAKKLSPGASRLLFDEANLLLRSGRSPQAARALLRKYQSAPRTADDPSPYEIEQLSEKLEKLEK